MAKSECSFVIDDEVGSAIFSDAFELSDTLNVGMQAMPAWFAIFWLQQDRIGENEGRAINLVQTQRHMDKYKDDISCKTLNAQLWE